MSLSLALGRIISEKQSNISYRFVSDFPFANRAPHVLDAFERSSLAALRVHPDQPLVEVAATGLSSTKAFSRRRTWRISTRRAVRVRAS